MVGAGGGGAGGVPASWWCCWCGSWIGSPRKGEGRGVVYNLLGPTIFEKFICMYIQKRRREERDEERGRLGCWKVRVVGSEQ